MRQRQHGEQVLNTARSLGWTTLRPMQSFAKAKLRFPALLAVGMTHPCVDIAAPRGGAGGGGGHKRA
eukprot:scaffold42798_cov66-Phaeocystis_antarctica.AAC.6